MRRAWAIAVLAACAACTEATDDLGPGDRPDAAIADAASPAPDAGVSPPDAGRVPDAGLPDAAPADAGAPDLGVPDAGSPDAGGLAATYLKAATPGVVHRFGDTVLVTRDDRVLLVGSPKYEAPLLDRYDLSDPAWTPEQTEMRRPTEASDWAPLDLAADRDATTLALGHADAIHLTRATPTEEGYARTLQRDASGYAVTGLPAPVEVPVSSYGRAVAISADGARAAVSASRWLPDLETRAEGPGVVFLYRRGPTGWAPAGTLAPPAELTVFTYGYDLAMSADGRTLAVGAPGEPPFGPSGEITRAVFVYDLGAEPPTLQASLTLPMANGSRFGAAVDLSSSGDALVVGLPGHNGEQTGVGADLGGFGARDSGAAAIYRRDASGAWRLETTIKPSNTHQGAAFGSSVAISADGDRVAVGAPHDTAVGTGIDGDDTPAPIGQAVDAGAVFVFERGAGGWAQARFLKPDALDRSDRFGARVSLGARVLAVGVPEDDSAAAGPNGDPADNTLSGAGAVYVYRFF